MEYIISKLMILVKEYDNDKGNLKIIEYGLKTCYLAISKFIFFALLTFSLNIFEEYAVFLLLFIGLRSVSFGIHASKSSHCWILSFLSFVGLPILCTLLNGPNLFKVIAMAICVILIYMNCPADTIKKPLVNIKKRRIYKISSLVISFSYCLIAIIINNHFIFNAVLAVLILDVILTAPITYKVLNQPYNNWKGGE